MSKSPLNYSDIATTSSARRCTRTVRSGPLPSSTCARPSSSGTARAARPSRRHAPTARPPVAQCPGNRRWAQVSFDALLLMASGAVSYVDHRDALLAADAIRFGGANQAIMWRAFAEHGLGEGAASVGGNDPDPTPSFVDPPRAGTASLQLRPLLDAKDAALKLYVGDYEGGACRWPTPTGDHDLGDTGGDDPRRLQLRGRGQRVRAHPGQLAVLPGLEGSLPLPLAAKPRLRRGWVRRRRVTASTTAQLIDEDRGDEPGPSLTVHGRASPLTVDLAGDQACGGPRVQVSAMLRPSIDAGRPRHAEPFQRPARLRGPGLRRHQEGLFGPRLPTQRVYTSPADAFQTSPARPRGADLVIESFKIPTTKGDPPDPCGPSPPSAPATRSTPVSRTTTPTPPPTAPPPARPGTSCAPPVPGLHPLGPRTAPAMQAGAVPTAPDFPAAPASTAGAVCTRARITPNLTGPNQRGRA